MFFFLKIFILSQTMQLKIDHVLYKFHLKEQQKSFLQPLTTIALKG